MFKGLMESSDPQYNRGTTDELLCSNSSSCPVYLYGNERVGTCTGEGGELLGK